MEDTYIADGIEFGFRIDDSTSFQNNVVKDSSLCNRFNSCLQNQKKVKENFKQFGCYHECFGKRILEMVKANRSIALGCEGIQDL
jgi:hypothetical protein